MFKKFCLVVALSVGLMTGTLLSLPAAREVQAGEFEVTSPTITGSVVVYPFQSFMVTATGFVPGESAELYLKRSNQAAPGTKITTADANGSGVLAHTVTLPSNIPYGPVQLRARNTQLSVDAVYTATVNPVLLLSVSSAAPGSSFAVRGYGFSASELYTVTFVAEVDVESPETDCIDAENTVTETLRSGFNTSTTGGFSFNAAVPEVDPDDYQIVALGNESGICTE